MLAHLCLTLCLLTPQDHPTAARVIRPALMISAGVADALSTRAAIESGKGREGNPAMRWAAESTPRLIAVKVAVNGAAAWAIEKYVAPDHPRLAWVIVASLSAFQFALSWHNVRVGR